MYPQQPYPQPQYPVYPQQGPAYAPASAYPPAPQYPQQPPAPPLPTGTLDEFYGQPSGGGGPSFKFMDANRNPLIGKTYAGIVARAITNGDIRAQTGQDGRPVTYKDGRPKFVMIVPMLVAQSPEFPDGLAGWWVKGQARDELVRAMAEAGAPEGPPEAGAGISVTLTGTRPIPGYNPQFIYRVVYRRPATGAYGPTDAVQQDQQSAPQQPGTAQAPVAQTNPTGGSTVPVPMQQVPQPQPAMAVNAPSLSPEQQALLAKLTGG